MFCGVSFALSSHFENSPNRNFENCFKLNCFLKFILDSFKIRRNWSDPNPKEINFNDWEHISAVWKILSIWFDRFKFEWKLNKNQIKLPIKFLFFSFHKLNRITRKINYCCTIPFERTSIELTSEVTKN